MSEGSRALVRQWIPMLGGSCDLRMGYAALERADRVFRDSVSRPRRCLVLCRADFGEEPREMLRRQLVSVGFEVFWHVLDAPDAPDGSARRVKGQVMPSLGLADSCALVDALASARLTSDDLVVAAGDAQLLSLASHVCGFWCGGTSLVAVPTDEEALLQGALVPGALEAGGVAGALEVKPCARRVLVDWDVLLSPLDSEANRHGRVLMVSAAMACHEREFSALWDNATHLMAGDVSVLTSQLVATAKARGKVASSASVAVRQSLNYGHSFAQALAPLTDAPRSLLVAEGLRFAARLSVAQARLDIDDMLAQDELLEALDIPTITCEVVPSDLVAALKAVEFSTSNRFLLLVPHAIGRVRATTVEDELLSEHAAAWCAAHRP